MQRETLKIDEEPPKAPPPPAPAAPVPQMVSFEEMQGRIKEYKDINEVLMSRLSLMRGQLEKTEAQNANLLAMNTEMAGRLNKLERKGKHNGSAH